MDSNKKSPVIAIGLPVYNEEKTLKKTLDSIMRQTFVDFEVIISDNNSTDNTEKICQEYSEENSKIQYFRQDKNIGILENWKFVLDKANSKYFVWIAADDWWESSFLEKNVSSLNSNKKFVGSVSRIDYYDVKLENNKKDGKILNFKIKKNYSYNKDEHNSRNYRDRISFYLRLNRAENIYEVFRTSVLKECVKHCWKKESTGMDLKILLFIQKFGEINLINEILLHRSGRGISSNYNKRKNLTKFNDLWIFGKAFPLLSYSLWVFKYLGPTIFLKNIDYIMFINLSAAKHQLKQFFKK